MLRTLEILGGAGNFRWGSQTSVLLLFQSLISCLEVVEGFTIRERMCFCVSYGFCGFYDGFCGLRECGSARCLLNCCRRESKAARERRDCVNAVFLRKRKRFKINTELFRRVEDRLISGGTHRHRHRHRHPDPMLHTIPHPSSSFSFSFLSSSSSSSPLSASVSAMQGKGAWDYNVHNEGLPVASTH